MNQATSSLALLSSYQEAKSLCLGFDASFGGLSPQPPLLSLLGGDMLNNSHKQGGSHGNEVHSRRQGNCDEGDNVWPLGEGPEKELGQEQACSLYCQGKEQGGSISFI